MLPWLLYHIISFGLASSSAVVLGNATPDSGKAANALSVHKVYVSRRDALSVKLYDNGQRCVCHGEAASSMNGPGSQAADSSAATLVGAAPQVPAGAVQISRYTGSDGRSTVYVYITTTVQYITSYLYVTSTAVGQGAPYTSTITTIIPQTETETITTTVTSSAGGMNSVKGNEQSTTTFLHLSNAASTSNSIRPNAVRTTSPTATSLQTDLPISVSSSSSGMTVALSTSLLSNPTMSTFVISTTSISPSSSFSPSSSIAATTTTSAGTPSDTNLVVNGGFEALGEDQLAPWFYTDGVTYSSTKRNSGTYSAFFNSLNDFVPSSTEYSLSQSLANLYPYSSYILAYALDTYNSQPQEFLGTCTFTATFNDVEVDSVMYSSDTPDTFALRSASFVPTSDSGTLSFTLACEEQYGAMTTWLDDVSVILDD